MKIQDAHIIITGAGSGFGKAMSLHFASHGAKVHAFDINEEALSVLQKENEDISIYTCDVSNQTQVEQTVEAAFEADSQINALINNAGIMKNAPLINLLKRPDSKHDFDLWDQVIKVNQYSVFLMTRSVVEKMIRKRNKGVLLHMSSIAAQGNAGQTAYAASKAAVEAMSKAWSKEFGSFGIRSVCIAPGFINTLGTHDALEEKMLAHWVSQTPLRRTGEIDEIVHAATFAIENDFFNGETIHLNGGLTI